MDFASHRTFKIFVFRWKNVVFPKKLLFAADRADWALFGHSAILLEWHSPAMDGHYKSLYSIRKCNSQLNTVGAYVGLRECMTIRLLSL